MRSRFVRLCRARGQQRHKALESLEHEQLKPSSLAIAVLDQVIKAVKHDKHVALQSPFPYNLFRGVEQSGSSSGS